MIDHGSGGKDRARLRKPLHAGGDVRGIVLSVVKGDCKAGTLMNADLK